MDANNRMTYSAAARMDAEFRGERNSATKEEDGVQNVENNHDDGMKSEVFFDGRRDEIEERQHSKDGAKHGKVDNGCIAADSLSDHVTDQSHYQEGPEELCQRY